MNTQLQDFARKNLLEGLEKLPEGWQDMFRRMYGKPTDVIGVVVANMPAEKLDWAMQQVARSIEKLSASSSNK